MNNTERNQERRYACMTVNQLRSETRRRPALIGSWIAAATKDALINALLDDDRNAKLAHAERGSCATLERLPETTQAPQQQVPLSEAFKIIMDRIMILEAKVEALSDKVDAANDKIMVSIG